MVDDPSSPASGAGSDLPADRIFVSNYVREIEIGVFAEERGTTQRVRFDIVLEVARDCTQDDTPHSVISYDGLVAAVDRVAEGPRINLLEMLAERIAALCLADRRARRVKVRAEKLDRLPGGGLGVEITRQRGSADKMPTSAGDGGG